MHLRLLRIKIWRAIRGIRNPISFPHPIPVVVESEIRQPVINFTFRPIQRVLKKSTPSAAAGTKPARVEFIRNYGRKREGMGGMDVRV